MESSPDYLPPVQRYKKYLKEQFEKFKKTPYTLPVGAAIVALIFYGMLVYMFYSCLLPILPPFVMLAVFFWLFEVRRVKKLLLAGLIACTAMLLVMTGFIVNVYTDYELKEAHSDDYVLHDGWVTPPEGDEQTVFNFTLEIELPEDPNATITNVTVIIVGMDNVRNETMTLAYADNETAYYYYTTTLSNAINQHAFGAIINETWYLAIDFKDGEEIWAVGPVFSSTWEVTKPILYYSAMQVYLQFMGIYTMIVGMIWWTRRTRRMREKQLSDWETKRKEAIAKAPKEDTKVPSLAKAMGLEEEDDEGTFVCSECGADVPADATECPQCGEKFD